MPEKTFFNLSPEKQQEIINISIEEFSKHDFEAASLNRIIDNSGVAKGSFYRYFKNKEDLYDYIIEFCINKRYMYLKNYFDDINKNFFLLYKEIMKAVISFNIINPLYGVFLMSLNARKYAVKNLFGIDEFNLLGLINRAKEKGEISKTYETEFVLHCVLQCSVNLMDYILLKNKDITLELATKPEETYKKYENQIDCLFDQLIGFLMNGFANK